MRARLPRCPTGGESRKPHAVGFRLHRKASSPRRSSRRPRGRGSGLGPARPPAFGPGVSGLRAVLWSPRRAPLCRGAGWGPHRKPGLGCRGPWGGLGTPHPSSAAPLRPRPPGADSVPCAGGPGSGFPSLRPQPWNPKLLFLPLFRRSTTLTLVSWGLFFTPRAWTPRPLRRQERPPSDST